MRQPTPRQSHKQHTKKGDTNNWLRSHRQANGVITRPEATNDNNDAQQPQPRQRQNRVAFVRNEIQADRKMKEENACAHEIGKNHALTTLHT